MKLSRYQRKNIFCIEGNWSNNLKKRTSIKSALEFLEHNANVESIHRHSSTPEQFEDLLTTSLQRTYQKFGIIYLAFHGNEGVLHIGKRKKITLNEIAEILDGKATDKILHFGACSTLNIPGRQLTKFWKRTGALAVSGYTTDVDFIPSTFLDLLYFEFCQKYRKIYCIERDVKKYYNPMAKKLGFKMMYERF